MNNKILLGSIISVVILILVSFTSVIGVNSESKDGESSLDIGRCFCKGLLFNPPKSEPDTYFAIWLFYMSFYPTEEGLELIILDWVTLKGSAYMGRMYGFRFGLFIYVFGYFEGGLEIL